MNKRKRIGFVTDVIGSEYCATVMSGVRRYCVENNIELLLFSVGGLKITEEFYSYNQFFSAFSFVSKNNLDGIVLCSGTLVHSISQQDLVSYLNDLTNVPVVSASVRLDGIPSVVADCTVAFDALIQRLIDEQHCKKFALMGVKSNSQEVRERTAIFTGVLTRNGIPRDKTVYFESDFTYADAYRLLYEYNEKTTVDFDAIVALCDDMAFACIDFCQKFLHKKVPDDIIVTGFDNFARAAISSPTLTSVDHQIATVGYSCAKLLHQKLNNQGVPEVQTVFAKTVLRESSQKKPRPQNAQAPNTEFIEYESKAARELSCTAAVFSWYTRRSEILQAANFYCTQDRSIDIYGIGSIITDNLQKFGFQGAAVVIYEKPINNENPFKKFKLPQKAMLLSGFDYIKDFNTKNTDSVITFNPSKTILPEECMEFSPEGIVVFSLFYDEEQFGYILIKSGDYDVAVYEVLKNIISAQIKFSFDCTAIEKERTKIINQNVALDIIAQTDEMTGIKNRRGFFEFGKSLLSFAEKNRQTGFLLYCDMDGLKRINDTYGHKAGDSAIIAQAKILNKSFRSADVLARLSGDEFAIICPQMEEEKIIEKKALIANECAAWKKREKLPFDISISIGYIKYPLADNCYKIDALLSEADKQLYKVKKEKKRIGTATPTNTTGETETPHGAH